MNMQRHKHLSWQIFLILFFGFIILLSSGFFIVNSYWRLNRSNLTPVTMADEIVRIIKLSNNIKPEKLQVSQKLIPHPGIWTAILQQKPNNLQPMTNVSKEAIQELLLKKPNNLQLLITLKNQQYLYVNTILYRPLSYQLEFYSAFLLWFIALIGFCYYITRRLASPLEHFINGASRFAQDINAPPIAEIGPKSIKAAFQAFNQMQTNLKQLIQNRTQMLAAISHDLRTPITRLKLRLENLPGSVSIEKMQSDLDQMETMIQAILQFAQNEYQLEQVVKLDLVALCESICEDLQEMDLPVILNHATEQIICLGRPLSLRRAIINLINNGLKYGGTVTINLQAQNNEAKISISDQGPGIPDSELEQVFLPFYRGDQSRNSRIPGTGLGLTTTRDIIRGHNGEVELHNIPGGGLNAIVRLPLNVR